MALVIKKKLLYKPVTAHFCDANRQSESNSPQFTTKLQDSAVVAQFKKKFSNPMMAAKHFADLIITTQ